MQWALKLSSSWGYIQFNSLTLSQLLAATLIIIVLLMPKAVINRLLLAPLCLCLLFPVRESVAAKELKLHILDVGQGLAIIVQTAEHSLVYDTGANLSDDFNIGAAVLVPVLRKMGIEHLDRIIISHSDNDHAGGLSGLLASIDSDAIYSSTQSINTRQAVLNCRSEQQWNWDGIQFRFLYVSKDYASANNSSCVLQITAGINSVLLAGDIESAAEKDLVLKYGESLSSSVLIAPHHGSSTSSTYALLKNVKPEYVVFSSGYKNSFNHPDRRIVLRYKQFSAAPVSTAESGMISFAISPNVSIATPKLFRQESPRYWR